MSESVRQLILRLLAAGFSVESISRTVGLSVYDVRGAR
jgi:hypothetical protein